MRFRLMTGAAAGALCVLLMAPQPAGAQAQQTPQTQRQPAQTQQGQAQQGRMQQGQAQQGQQVAQRCLNDLQAFRGQMREDGLWLSGYRSGYGWPSDSAAARYDATAGTGMAGTPPRVGVGPGAGPGVGPWGGMGWRMPPMQELRALHSAAVVLARRGEETGCQMVLTELREAYGQYGQQLRQAGDGVRGYRREQISNARPVSELGGVLRADTITGTDVRSPRDEYLGSIEDVILDPDNGQITYAIIARGGFMGIGEDYVAVPWKRLRATRDLDTFVLDTTEDALGNAPEVNIEGFANPEIYQRRRQEIDSWWQQQGRAG